MGAWIALRARREGWRTTLIDAFGAGNARATSGDETRIIRASHSDDPFYSRWSREALTAWNALAEAIGERLFVPAGVLWLAHEEGGWEASSEATLREPGHPRRAALPGRGGGALAADALGRPRVRDLRARGRPADGSSRGRGRRAHVRRRKAAASNSAGRSPGRSMAGGSSTSRWAMAGARPRPSSCSPRARGCRGSFPEAVGDLIRVTKQDVLFVGLARRAMAGSRRDQLPCWLDSGGAVYGVPAVDGRGMKVGPDRYGPPFDPTDGERIVDPESVEIVRALPGHALPGPRRRPGRRDARLPVRVDAGQPVPHRPAPGLRQRLAGRRRLRPRLQARAGHRPLRRRAASTGRASGRARNASASTARERGTTQDRLIRDGRGRTRPRSGAARHLAARMVPAIGATLADLAACDARAVMHDAPIAAMQEGESATLGRC